jgi:N-acetylglucosamine-6-sulfatase
VVAALALAASITVLAPAGGGAQAPVATGPNFVVIMSDDQAPAMMGALPTVRRELSGVGTTFTNALASYPLCCPARATLLTGEYAHNHGTLGNNPGSGGGYRALISPERNLAAWLQAAGYATGFVGKWLNGLRTPRRAPPGWSQWYGLTGAGGEGLSSFYDYDVFEPDGSPRHFGDRPADYQTDALTRHYALPFIDAQAATPGPFFLWLAYHPPHNGVGRDDAAGRRCSEGRPDARGGQPSAIPPPRYARRFRSARVPRPPSFDEQDVSDKPKFVRRQPRLDPSDLERITRDYRCGLAALLALDDAVERIVDHLEATGQLAGTVLMFLPDQGVMAGEHRVKRGKNRPYEEAIRIPLLMRGPGVVPGAEIDAPVANADLAPTILDLANAQIPAELARPIDGTSLAPVLAGAPEDRRRAVLIEGRGSVAGSRRGFKVRSYVGVRTARYAYFEYRRARFDTRPAGAAAPIGAGRATEHELYDLDRDPYELRNLDRSPAYAEARGSLAGVLERLERCSGPECVVEATVPGPSAPPARRAIAWAPGRWPRDGG